MRLNMEAPVLVKIRDEELHQVGILTKNQIRTPVNDGSFVYNTRGWYKEGHIQQTGQGQKSI